RLRSRSSIRACIRMAVPINQTLPRSSVASRIREPLGMCGRSPERLTAESNTMIDKLTILYIEDNADNQRLVKRILEARGYGVLLSEDGPNGIALARESTPSLILVDINIPGLDGYETTTRLRGMEHLRGTPIVAPTADTRIGTRER